LFSTGAWGYFAEHDMASYLPHRLNTKSFKRGNDSG
jgi:hypothetical protein